MQEPTLSDAVTVTMLQVIYLNTNYISYAYINYVLCLLLHKIIFTLVVVVNIIHFVLTPVTLFFM